MNQFPHDRTHDDLAVLPTGYETLREADNHRVVLHCNEGRHVERFPHPGVARFTDPRFALYRTPRRELLRGKAYVCHDLLNPVTVFEQSEFGKDGSDGGRPDPRNGIQQISLLSEMRIMLDVPGDLLLELRNLLVQVGTVFPYGARNRLVGSLEMRFSSWVRMTSKASTLLTNAWSVFISGGSGAQGSGRIVWQKRAMTPASTLSFFVRSSSL